MLEQGPDLSRVPHLMQRIPNSHRIAAFQFEKAAHVLELQRLNRLRPGREGHSPQREHLARELALRGHDRDDLQQELWLAFVEGIAGTTLCPCRH